MTEAPDTAQPEPAVLERPVVPAPGHCAQVGADTQADWRRRLWLALVLSLALSGTALLAAWPAAPAWAQERPGAWLQLALATIAVCWCGWPVLAACWRALRARRPDPRTLIVLGTLLVYGFSVLAVLAPELLPDAFRQDGRVALYFTTAALIVAFALLAQVIEMHARRWTGAAALQDAATSSRLQSIAGRSAAWLVPGVLVIALAAAIAWARLGPQPPFAYALLTAVATFVIANPRALDLAVSMPMRIARAQGGAAGIEFSGDAGLERLYEVDTVVLDRTTAVSEGQPELLSVIPVSGVSETELLRFAASLEQAGSHPFAAVIVAAANRSGVKLGRNSGFRQHPGLGVTGVVQLRNVAVGSEPLMELLDVDVSSLQPEAQRLRALGQSAVFVAIDGAPLGVLGLADRLREGSWEAVQALRRDGIRVVLLSGDHELTVQTIAEQLGIEEWHAGVMPDEKPAIVTRLRSEGRSVAMAGDGASDAASLAAADVGIAIGTSMQSADVLLPGTDPHLLPSAIRLSERAVTTARQNFVLAAGYNAAAVIIAAGALHPALGLLPVPAVAAAAMCACTAAVTFNALRLRRMQA